MKKIGISLNIAFLLCIVIMAKRNDWTVIICSGISAAIVKLCDFALYYKLYND